MAVTVPDTARLILSIFNFRNHVFERAIMIKSKIIGFTGVFILLFSCASWFFSPPKQDLSVIYYEPSDTIDVLFVGSSHTYCGINPNVLWRGEGIAAYNFTSGGQPLWTSYYYINEALKSQKPSLIVLDMLYTFVDYDNGYRPKEQNTLNPLYPSFNKLNMVRAGIGPEHRISVYLAK